MQFYAIFKLVVWYVVCSYVGRQAGGALPPARTAVRAL